ncbi:hypothetical protein BST61_g8486 [Cercospora zeina]
MRVSLEMAALVASTTTVLASPPASPLSPLAASETGGTSEPIPPLLAVKEPGQHGHLVSKSYRDDAAIEDKRRVVDCDADQLNTVTDALRLVQERLRHLLQKHDGEISQPGSDSRRLLELFFGKDLNEEKIAFITDKLHRVITEAWQPLYHCQEQCNTNIAARYEWKSANGTRNKDIFFCPIFFASQKDLGIEQGRWRQALYAIHEGIHSLIIPESPNDIGDTPLYFGPTAAEAPPPPGSKPQIAYGDNRAEQLAAYSSEAAMFNADNYRAYVEALHKAETSGRVQESDRDVDYGSPPPQWTTIWEGHMRTSTTALSVLPTTAATMSTTSQTTTTTTTMTAAEMVDAASTELSNWGVEFVGDAVTSSDALSTVREHFTNWWYGYGIAAVAGFMFVVM